MKQHFLILLLIAGLFSCNSKQKKANAESTGITNGVDTILFVLDTIPNRITVINVGKDSELVIRPIALSYVTSAQLTKVTTDLTKAYKDANLLQDKRIDALITQVSTATKTITALQAQLKNYSIDSAATKKRLTDAEAKLFTVDTTVQANTTQQDSLIRLTNKIIVYPDSTVFSLNGNKLTLTKPILDALKKLTSQ